MVVVDESVVFLNTIIAADFVDESVVFLNTIVAADFTSQNTYNTSGLLSILHHKRYIYLVDEY